MSQYVEIHRKNRFDVRIQELVSKVQDPRGFLRKNGFYGRNLGFSDFFLVAWPFSTALNLIINIVNDILIFQPKTSQQKFVDLQKYSWSSF